MQKNLGEYKGVDLAQLDVEIKMIIQFSNQLEGIMIFLMKFAF